MSSLHSTAILPVIGAIAGDIIGSPYELKGHRIKTTEFPLFSTESKFTDDSVLTIAVAKWCVMGQSNGLEAIVRELCLRYFDVGFGHSFKEWLRSDNPQPYNSWGNGSAMRVSPVCLTAMSIPHVLDLAEKTAIITHNHRDGVKGAQAVACAIFLATFGFDKESIKLYLEHEFGYDLRRRLSDIRESYEFDASCPGSVPESIISFLESTDFESAVRNAVSLGGDADTQACIAGSIAAAFYKRIPDAIIHEVFDRLPEEFISILHSYSRINPPEERIINVESVTSIEMDCYLRYNFALVLCNI